jgi:hypothetical protein
MPKPLSAKSGARKPTDGPFASHYAPLIHVLRAERGFTWDEARNWFSKHGVGFSTGVLVDAYRKWMLSRTRGAE